MTPDFLKFLGTSSNRAIGACLGILAANDKLKPGDECARWDVKVASNGKVELVGPRTVTVVPAQKRTKKS